jgi:hypothetical protein
VIQFAYGERMLRLKGISPAHRCAQKFSFPLSA